MRIRIIDLTSGIQGGVGNMENTVNSACAALEAEGRTIVDVTTSGQFTRGPGQVIIKHVAVRKTDDAGLDDLHERLTELANGIQQGERPEAESYDDTESAYGNGIDVANWEAGDRIREVIEAIEARTGARTDA